MFDTLQMLRQNQQRAVAAQIAAAQAAGAAGAFFGLLPSALLLSRGAPVRVCSKLPHSCLCACVLVTAPQGPLRVVRCFRDTLSFLRSDRLR
jgi:hypothetical protein